MSHNHLYSNDSVELMLVHSSNINSNTNTNNDNNINNKQESSTTSTASSIKRESTYLAKLYIDWSLVIYPRIYPFAYPFAIIFQITTVWINVAMSVDRFVAIHFPLKSLKYCTISNAKRIIKFIFLFAILYSAPRFFEYHTCVDKIKLNNQNNDTLDIVFFKHTQIGGSNLFKIIVYLWMYLLFHSIVPLIILTMLNFSLVYSVKTSDKFVHRLSANYTTKLTKSSRTLKVIFNKEKTRKETTVMLISVVILFIVLHTPSVICNIMHSINTDKSSSVQINTLCYVGNFLIITNSSTNFFSYCLFNRRFRQELAMCMLRLCCKSLFKAYRKKKQLSVSISYNNFVYNLKKYEKKGASQTSLNAIKKSKVIYFNNNQVEIIQNDVLMNNKDLHDPICVIGDCQVKEDDVVLPLHNSINNIDDDDDVDDTDSENGYNINDNEITESNVAYV